MYTLSVRDRKLHKKLMEVTEPTLANSILSWMPTYSIRMVAQSLKQIKQLVCVFKVAHPTRGKVAREKMPDQNFPKTKRNKEN